jgi:hypothetical protein
MTSYVYIICTVIDGSYCAPVKVGMSENPEGRISTLQTGNPNQLHLYQTFSLPNRDIAEAIESAFHQVCSNRRMVGEWFSISPTQTAALMECNIRSHVEIHCGFSGLDAEKVIELCMAGV